ncbi:hypothetical protein Cgig2_024591 [Carnegiea gigantea]|uniref:Uncharacterized protein n=1 Tax=Carnegiea gigantea TaxID=171969 RepID=A0A9Q1KJU1_9CARY|nr:hypothetical protein Cgig2_024591 [Carnegiea gigantea]
MSSHHAHYALSDTHATMAGTKRRNPMREAGHVRSPYLNRSKKGDTERRVSDWSEVVTRLILSITLSLCLFCLRRLGTVTSLWMSALGAVGLALNLRAYDLISPEIRATEDPEFEIFYTKNILLNEGIRAWMAAQDQPHENLIFPEERKGLILLPHLATLGWGVGLSGEVIDTFPYCFSRVLHLISSVVLGFGGNYHALLGPEILEESFPFFGYVWKDRNKMITILGIHLILLGTGTFLLVFKALYFRSVYDIWAPDTTIASSPGKEVREP